MSTMLAAFRTSPEAPCRLCHTIAYLHLCHQQQKKKKKHETPPIQYLRIPPTSRSLARYQRTGTPPISNSPPCAFPFFSQPLFPPYPRYSPLHSTTSRQLLTASSHAQEHQTSKDNLSSSPPVSPPNMSLARCSILRAPPYAGRPIRLNRPYTPFLTLVRQCGGGGGGTVSEIDLTVPAQCRSAAGGKSAW
ncbi:hypothetical protein K505DRAFT_118369 [Melanomma pulvis-pyrius CBS 109.77]|uniref:Uncharacterized protein n=1 Tax=Melanomma pulvis-pyrius CBS 109.77 TaxID=1314802 RepID=A0A6A6WV53_9PLEO|nr:hypothetical protein K505DRAFT_118369 [Melanomma pulvis-pyrius CBS 109.77]